MIKTASNAIKSWEQCGFNSRDVALSVALNHSSEMLELNLSWCHYSARAFYFISLLLSNVLQVWRVIFLQGQAGRRGTKPRKSSDLKICSFSLQLFSCMRDKKAQLNFDALIKCQRGKLQDEFISLMLKQKYIYISSACFCLERCTHKRSVSTRIFFNWAKFCFDTFLKPGCQKID